MSTDDYAPDQKMGSLDVQAQYILEEAKATRCSHIQLQDALLVLTFERWERGIINKDERDRLITRLYE